MFIDICMTSFTYRHALPGCSKCNISFYNGSWWGWVYSYVNSRWPITWSAWLRLQTLRTSDQTSQVMSITGYVTWRFITFVILSLECVPNRGEFSVFSSVGRGNLGNYSKPRQNFDTVLCRKIWEFFCTLPHEIWLSTTKVMNDFTGSGNPWTQSCWPRDWPPWNRMSI